MTHKTTSLVITGDNLNVALAEHVAYGIAAGRAFGLNQKISLTLHQLRGNDNQLNILANNIEECSLLALQDINTDANAFINADYIIICLNSENVIEVVNLAKILIKLIIKNINNNLKIIVAGNDNSCLTAALLRQLAVENNIEAAIKDRYYCTAVTAHVQNCLRSCVARRLELLPRDIKQAVVWGTVLPDLSYEKLAEKNIDENWKNFSVKNKLNNKKYNEIDISFALIRHLSYLSTNHKGDEWVMMGVPGNGLYGIPKGLIFGLPLSIREGKLDYVADLSPDEFMTEKIMLIVKGEVYKVEFANKYLKDE